MTELTTADPRGTETEGLMNSFGKAIRVLFSPLEVFQTLDKRPNWLAPLLICVLVAGLSSWIILNPITIPEQREQMEKRFQDQGMTEEQLESATRFFEGELMVLLAVLSPVLLTPLMFLAVAAVLHFMCVLVLSGQSNFRRTFAVTVYSYMPFFLPAAVVKVPLQLLKETSQVHAGLGLLLSAPEESAGFGYRFAYNFLAQVDVFNLWTVVLLAVGVSVIFKFSRQKSYYAVGGLWGLWALGSAVFGALMHR